MKTQGLFLTVFLFSIIFAGFHFEAAQAASSVSGVIGSNTTWSRAAGPWDLTGNVLIETGATVIVESGAVVNLNGYYIRVNGSLIVQQGVTLNMGVTGSNVGNIQVNGVFTARGTSSNPIQFNGGMYHWDSLFVPSTVSYVTFAASSVGWNEQTGSGCIIEHALMDKTGVTASSSIKYSNNRLTGAGVSLTAGSPVISNNIISSGISIHGGSPVIANNDLTNGYIWIEGNHAVDSPVITSNFISNTNPQWPYSTAAGIAVLADAYSSDGIILIEKNVIKGSSIGIDLIYRESQNIDKPLTIRYNTIISNDACIQVAGKFSPSIANNNFYGNNSCLKLTPSSRDVAAAQNYWGTTDSQAIDRLIYDYTDDFDLGKVAYTPILTSPDPSAPDPNAPIPSADISYPTISPTPNDTPTTTPTINPTPNATIPTPFQNPTGSPNPLGAQTDISLGQDWGQIAVIALLAVISILLAANLLFLRRRRINRQALT